MNSIIGIKQFELLCINDYIHFIMSFYFVFLKIHQKRLK
jgi:hypothetical protein